MGHVPPLHIAVFTCVMFACFTGATAAQAAAVRAPSFACRVEADARKAEDMHAKNDRAALEPFMRTKIAAGTCMSMSAGMSVNVDEKHPPFVCVRLSGGLDCYWLPATSIDLKPADPETRGIPDDPRSLKF